MIEARYGKCVVTGEALVGFGVAVVNSNRYYSHEAWFVPHWTMDCSEAVRLRAESLEKLSALKRELEEQKTFSETRKKAEALKAEACGLNFIRRSDALCNIQNASLPPQDVESLRKWISGAEATITEARRVMQEEEATRQNRLAIKPVIKDVPKKEKVIREIAKGDGLNSLGDVFAGLDIKL